MTAEPRWRCPECGRSFKARNQWHSCATRTVKSHFVGKPPAVRAAFDQLLEELRQVGPFRVEAVKTMINLAGRAHFGSVTPAMDGFNVGFVLSRRLEDRRILRTEELSPSLFSYRAKVRKMTPEFRSS